MIKFSRWFCCLVFSILWLSSFIVSAQEKCGTVEIRKDLQSQGRQESETAFENWLIQKASLLKQNANLRQHAGPFRIPVVFHIIHNGEPVGTGVNVPTQQILSQLKVLNDDFRRNNADKVNTPAQFTPVAGSMDITFELARRDPEGSATNGIVRVNGQRTSWSSADKQRLSDLSYWPAEDYLNIWVCNLTDFLGLAQFPVSDLPGLENSSNNRLTDGLILWHKALGSKDDGNFVLDPLYDKGRTATHEIAHFFGLKHIWGDDTNCTGTDHVDDTPNQGESTEGCPSHPQITCGETTMFQNFMDYTDDRCMNLFTQGQVSRMEIVIQNSPRRKSLLTSLGLSDPNPVDNDLGIRSIISPLGNQCSYSSLPTIEVRNYGKNNITHTRIELKSAEETIEVKDFSLSLAPGEITNLQFSSLTLGVGDNQLAFRIVQTNHVADGDATGNDNVVELNAYIPHTIAAPFSEGFETMPANWRIVNPDQVFTWDILSAPYYDQSNTALGVEFYKYESGIAETDVIYTPVFNLSGSNNPVLSFDVSHARLDLSHDRFRIVAIPNCGSLENGTVIYDKTGPDLATSRRTENYFRPTSTEDWRGEVITLDQFVGVTALQLAFVAVNDYGNNLYIDNVSVSESPFTDLSIIQILSPGIVECDPSAPIQFEVENKGESPLTAFTANIFIDDVLVESELFSGFNLASGTTHTFETKDVDFGTGEHELRLILIPETNGYDNPVNNSITTKVVVAATEDFIPLRLTFDDDAHANWLRINPKGGMNWEIISLEDNSVIYFNAYENQKAVDQAWFVSPLLDFSLASTTASMVFDISSRFQGLPKGGISVVVSTDCSSSFDTLTITLPTFDNIPDAPWVPSLEEDWNRRVLVDLSAYAGKDNIRVAIVFTDLNNNNVYLDNIEFFLTDRPNDVLADGPYNIYGYDFEDPAQTDLKIGFNLESRQHVLMQIVDTHGRLMKEIVWHDVLNQIIDLPQSELADGLYILRLRINGRYYSSRMIITGD